STSASSSNSITVTSASIPASVDAPVQGTDLTAIWNLQFSGTGASGFTNGVWPSGITPGSGGTNTGIPTYPAGLGFVWANHDGCIYLNIGSSSVTISNYDFTLCGPVTINGTGTVTFQNCAFPTSTAFLGSSVGAPYDINGSGQNTTLAVICNQCTFDTSVFFSPSSSGSWTNTYCTFSNQTGPLC